MDTTQDGINAFSPQDRSPEPAIGGKLALAENRVPVRTVLFSNFTW
jgi:hypothetical protein